MHPKAVLVVALVAALAAVFFLFGGAELFAPSAPGVQDPAAGGSAGDPLTGGAGPDEAADAPAPERGPVLFGRTRAERAGVGSLTGRVMDFESGKPLAGATLVVAGTGYGGEATALQETTGEDGRFRYAALAAGDGYGLHVRDTQGRQRTLSSLAVDAGSEKDVGVVWMGQAAPLAGVVLGPDGLPVASADVQVHAGGGSMVELLRNMTKLLEVLDQDARPEARVRSERTGQFAFEKLAPGPYTLLVRAPGHQLATRKLVMTNAGPAGGPLTVRLQAAQPLVGVVVDDRDRPIAGARVAFLAKNDMESVFFGRQYTVTDDAGRFRVDAPPTQGALNAIVTAEGYPTLFAEAPVGVAELRFVLVAGAEVLLRVLETETERPVEGARLMAMFAESLQAAGSQMTFASGLTDARGEALFLARPGKLQMLFVGHEERGNAMFNPMMAAMGQVVAITGPKDTTVKAPRTELVFHVAAGVTVRGKVADDAGKPLAGVRVSTMGMMGGGAATTSAADGTYELRNQGLPVMLVMAALPGYVQVFDSAAAMNMMAARPQDGVLERDLVMRRAASLTGRVVDPRGRPLAGVEVKIGSTDAMAMMGAFTGGTQQTITNATGTYLLDGITPGPKTHVMGHMPGYLDSKTVDFEARAGVVEAPDLVMQQGTRLEVRVRGPDGNAVREARIEVNVSSSEQVAWDPLRAWQGFADLRTDAAGKAEVEDLPDGTVTLTITKAGFAGARATVATKRAEGTRREVEVQLEEGVTLRGRVLDVDGKPLEGAVVQTQPMELALDGQRSTWVPRVSATTGADGRFELAGLPAGSVQVMATAAGFQPATRQAEAGGDALELRLQKVDADVQKRIEAIDQELQSIYAQFAQGKDEAERQALSQRMLQLQQERAKLQGAEVPAAVPDEDVDGK